MLFDRTLYQTSNCMALEGKDGDNSVSLNVGIESVE